MMYKLRNLEKSNCKVCKKNHGEFWTRNCKPHIFDQDSNWYEMYKDSDRLVRAEWCPQKHNYGYANDI